ncbi:MAG: hypothetical protein LUM44_15280 [Pyrinomonadaceae bacterium]|nr:hypothetical protein [Pyrinomonadaceae bacterium]
MQALKAYEEVAELIASVNPAKVLAFRPSEETKNRVSELIDREKNAEISSEEKSELDYYMKLEHLMRMAKILAHKYENQK